MRRTTMKTAFLTAFAAACTLAVASCAAPGRPLASSGTHPGDPSAGPAAPGRPLASSGMHPGDPAADPTGTAPAPRSGGDAGEIVVNVRWPSYGVQAIPTSAGRVDFRLWSGGTSVATRSVTPGSGPAMFERVQVGTYTLEAQAMRVMNPKVTVARATASVTVVANRRTQAAFPLALEYPPAFTSLTLREECEDQVQVHTLKGSGQNLLPFADSTYSVLLDGQPLALSEVADYGNTFFEFAPPARAGATGSVQIVVDGATASATRTFSRVVVRRVALTPGIQIISRNATASLEAVAYSDEAGTATASAAILWSMPVTDPPIGETSPFGLADGEFQSYDTAGSAIVEVRAGCATATASVKVQ